jgi:hypothetical protein
MATFYCGYLDDNVCYDCYDKYIFFHNCVHGHGYILRKEMYVLSKVVPDDFPFRFYFFKNYFIGREKDKNDVLIIAACYIGA